VRACAAFVRAADVRLLFDAVLVVWIGSEVVIGFRSLLAPRGTRRDRWSGPALLLGVYLAVFIGSGARLDAAFAIGGRPTEVFALGIALALAGIAIRWYAVLTLGRFFTTRVQTTAQQTVVDSGPYRWIRHPSYTGALLTILGILVCYTNWISVACFLIAVPGFLYRIKVEEAALMSALGRPYVDYMRRTKRLVPFVV
jgi:protein-S-isoprenylcysteine O-methyltransferase Ste14